MRAVPSLSFDQSRLFDGLAALDAQGLNAVNFGVIGFDGEALVQRYNSWESRAAGLELRQVMGLHLFDVVAQCMNNYLVAQRFEDSAAAGTELDETLDFVLTLRMRPSRVKLRLLAAPGHTLRYVCIERQA
jgi:photoactive yellow protein